MQHKTRLSQRRSSAPDYQLLEPRQLLAADIYEPGFDPYLGATVTTFVGQDPQDANDPWDVETGWLQAVEELAQIGADQVNFAVYRRVDSSGVFSAGPAISSVRSAIDRASDLGLTVSVLPIFETDAGWRGDYNPSGAARTGFQNGYSQFVLELASLDGVDRLTVASELNAMVADSNNNAFFDSLIQDVKQSSFDGQIGFTANFDAYQTPQFNRIWANPDIDFLGVSAYANLIGYGDYDSISGTGEVSEAALDQMVDAWTQELDSITSVASQYDLPVFIQEFGSVKRNFTSIFPWAVTPSDFVSNDAENRYADDPREQAATYRSLMIALEGRGDEIIGADFWSWEHQANRGQRSFDLYGSVIDHFAVWPTDNAGGSELSQFLGTRQETNQLTAVDDFFSSTQAGSLDVVGNDLNADQAAIVGVSNVSRGDVTLNEDGSLAWDAGFQGQEFIPVDVLTGDGFGRSVAIDNGIAVIGAPNHDSNLRNNNGAIYVYQLQNDIWQQVAKVVSPTNRSGDLFGWSVDIEGDKIVVGAIHDDQFASNSGAAYLVERGQDITTWTITQSLDASNARRGDRYGVSVAIDSGLIAVGNRFGDGAGLNTGTVSIFKSDASGTWTESDVLSNGVDGVHQFGWDVELHQSSLVVGAPRGTTGTAYLFSIDSNGQQSGMRELEGSSLQSGDRFGHSVAISESGVFVGAFLHDHNETINTGAVYRFSSEGDLVQKHVQNNPIRGDLFGFDVAAIENSFVASGVGFDVSGNSSGSVVHFVNESGVWTETQRHNPAGGYRSGHSVAIDGGTVLTGMIHERGATARRGKIYSFIQQPSSGADVTFDYTIQKAAEQLSGSADGSFGWSVTTSGAWAAVGSPTATTRPGVVGGLTTIFQRSGDQWQYYSTLAPGTIEDGDFFGGAVKLDGDRLVVGAHLSDTGAVDAGSVYVYQLTDTRWVLNRRLFAEIVNGADQFGYSVDVEGDRIAVGAVFDESNSPTNSGTATVFDKIGGNWTRSATLVPGAGASNDRFGHAVALDQDRLVVSATRASLTGQAWVFVDNGSWSLEAVLTGAGSAIGDEFGNSISIEGSTIAIGAWKHDHNQIFDSGAVYIFELANNAWSESHKLTSQNELDSRIAFDRFGSAVELDNGRLVVGSMYDDSIGVDSGSIFLFDSTDDYEITARFVGRAGSRQGRSLSISGDQMFVGGELAGSQVLVQDLNTSTASATVSFN